MEYKKWILLCILGGILIFISSIAEISIIFSVKYRIATKVLKEGLASMFSIILFIFGFIIMVGAILVILGSIIITTKDYKFGKSIINIGISIGLIGLIIFVITSIYLMLEIGIFTLLIVRAVIIYSGFCFLSILFAIVISILFAIVNRRKLKKLPEQIPEEEIPESGKQLSEIMISIDKLREEALSALNEGELIKTSEKYKEIKNVLEDYAKLV